MVFIFLVKPLNLKNIQLKVTQWKVQSIPPVECQFNGLFWLLQKLLHTSRRCVTQINSTIGGSSTGHFSFGYLQLFTGPCKAMQRTHRNTDTPLCVIDRTTDPHMFLICKGAHHCLTGGCLSRTLTDRYELPV